LNVGAARAEQAPAKVNLTLRVVGRRLDGYHDIDSLVVFAAVGDTLTFTAARSLALDVRGPTAGASGATAGNLVLKAANALAARLDGIKLGRFVLSKRLPVAAGVGGGSSDAAAALRLLARANRLALDDPRLHEAARATGADVPVCLDPRPRVMRGIGDLLSAPLDLPRLPAVMVNPGVAVPTKDVFAKLAAGPSQRVPAGQAVAIPSDRIGYLAFVERESNDLERPALSLQPVIAQVLVALRALPGCRLSRMSGSGATCFALFDSTRAASSAATALRKQHPDWWIRATTLG
jgi:4-diphosphocytidyl-2-C-methyl-D-erythritol kinase